MYIKTIFLKKIIINLNLKNPFVINKNKFSKLFFFNSLFNVSTIFNFFQFQIEFLSFIFDLFVEKFRNFLLIFLLTSSNRHNEFTVGCAIWHVETIDISFIRCQHDRVCRVGDVGACCVANWSDYVYQRCRHALDVRSILHL